MANNRLHNLDYLRGLAALSIMIYHYFSWGFGRYHAETFLGRVGVYGVSIFYVLSGLTLFHVYYTQMKPSLKEFRDFYVKRFFRIYPLLWLATILTIITQLPTKGIPDAYSLFINFSGLFGLIDWTNYIGTGVWSIGNELVFYLFFPLFIILSKKALPLFYLLTLILLATYLHFSFNILDPNIPVEPQKANYINPLNQVFLFLGGYLIGYFFYKTGIHPIISILLITISVIAFISIRAAGDSITIVSGSNRIWFTLICFGICLGFYKLTIQLPAILHKVLMKLGEASYSVYLIHPIVWAFFSFSSKLLAKNGFNLPIEWRITICLSSALVVSYLIYLTYERFFIKLGKNSLKRLG